MNTNQNIQNIIFSLQESKTHIRLFTKVHTVSVVVFVQRPVKSYLLSKLSILADITCPRYLAQRIIG